MKAGAEGQYHMSLLHHHCHHPHDDMTVRQLGPQPARIVWSFQHVVPFATYRSGPCGVTEAADDRVFISRAHPTRSFRRPHGVGNRPLSRRLDRCDRVIQKESGDPNGGNMCSFSWATGTSRVRHNADYVPCAQIRFDL